MKTIEYLIMCIGFGLCFFTGYRISNNRKRQFRENYNDYSDLFYHPQHELYYRFGIFDSYNYKTNQRTPSLMCDISKTDDLKTSDWVYSFEVNGGKGFDKEIEDFKKHLNAHKDRYTIKK